MIFPWDSIDSPSRSWSGSRKVAADRPWHHQDDRYGSGKIPRVSGRLHCELFGLKSLDARVFRLKGRKQKFSYFLVPRSESRGISRDVAMIHAGRNGSVPIMPCSWCTQQQLTGWVILSFFLPMDTNNNQQAILWHEDMRTEAARHLVRPFGTCQTERCSSADRIEVSHS